MASDSKYRVLAEATLCSFALIVFSLFIHLEIPLRLISYSALVLAAYLLSRQLLAVKDVFRITDGSIIISPTLIFIIAGIVSGILLAMFYRWFLDISFLPESIHWFVIIAALIGSAEELVFRGLLQEQVRSINGPFSVLFSTISHTGYKCCLFLAPGAAAGIDIPNLAFWTFLFGLLFGTIRHLSKSIIPSVLAHALFDILVYAEFTEAPWWVW
jgi:membrane protease YdiL (CAAX protease family)